MMNHQLLANLASIFLLAGGAQTQSALFHDASDDHGLTFFHAPGPLTQGMGSGVGWFDLDADADRFESR